VDDLDMAVSRGEVHGSVALLVCRIEQCFVCADDDDAIDYLSMQMMMMIRSYVDMMMFKIIVLCGG
jgi:hypothetical protein